MPEIFTFFHTAVYYGSCISKENFHPVSSRHPQPLLLCMQPYSELASTRNRGPCGKCAHLHGGGTVKYITQTKWSISGVLPPRPQCPIGFSREGVLISTRNRGPGSKCAHLHRRGTVGGIIKT